MLQFRLIILAVIAILIIASTNAKKVDITPRIVNGKNAERGQFPFYVFMDITTTKFFIFQIQSRCGASLISNEWVLTAGHCVSTQNNAETRLHLGSLRMDDEDEIGREIVTVTSKEVYLHPDYYAFLGMLNPQNDIAVVKLPSPVEFNQYINSVPLACPRQFERGALALVVGNGISDSGEAPSILQWAHLRISRVIKNGTIILATGLNKESIKPGDSGGPLVAISEKGEIHGLVGIVSFGGLMNTQGFTNIGAFFDWITTTTGITQCVQPKGEITLLSALARLLFGPPKN